jgi:beta-1,4-galactosyltransferase 1
MNALHTHGISYPSSKPTVSYNPDIDFVDDGTMILLDKYITARTKVVLEIGSCSGLISRYIVQLPQFHTGTLICADTWKETTTPILQEPSMSSSLSSESKLSTRKSASRTRAKSRKTRSSSIPFIDTDAFDTFISNIWEVRRRVVALRIAHEAMVSLLVETGIEPTVCYVHTQANERLAREQLHCLLQAFPLAVVISNGGVYNPRMPLVVNEMAHQYTLSDVDILSNGCAFIPSDHPHTKCNPSLVYRRLRGLPVVATDEPLMVRTAIIVAFHPKLHRKTTLNTFVQELHSLLGGSELIFKVFVMKQEEITIGANVGSLCNAGYQTAKSEGFNRFIFHDIHLIPRETMLPYYTYDAPLNGVLFLGKYALATTPDWFTFGAVMFTPESFERVNGFPSNIYGHAGWDYAMLQRLRRANIALYTPPPQLVTPFYVQGAKTQDLEEWERLYACQQAIKCGTNTKTNGLSDVYYELQKITVHTRKHTKQTIAVDYSVRVVSFKYFMTYEDDIVAEFPHIPPRPGEDVFGFELQTTDEVPPNDRSYGYIPEPQVYKVYKKSFLLKTARNVDKVNTFANLKDLMIYRDTAFYDKAFSYKDAHSAFSYYEYNINQHIKIRNQKQASLLYFSGHNYTEQQEVSAYHTFCKSHSNNVKMKYLHLQNHLPYHTEAQRNHLYKTLINILSPMTLKYDVVRMARLFEHESQHIHYFLTHCIVAMLKTKRGGSFMYALTNFQTALNHNLAHIFFILQKKFKNVKTVYSRYCHSGQNTIFIVCNGFQGLLRTEEISLIRILQSVVVKEKQNLCFKQDSYMCARCMSQLKQMYTRMIVYKMKLLYQQQFSLLVQSKNKRQYQRMMYLSEVNRVSVQGI